MWCHLNHVTCYVMILLVAHIHVVQSARDAILCNITVIDYSRLVLLIVGVGFLCLPLVELFAPTPSLPPVFNATLVS